MKTERKKLVAELDRVWSLVIRSKGHCECCERTTGQFHAHHLFGRIRKSVRWNKANGVCLCVHCHRGLCHAVAYDNQVTFHQWLVRYKGQAELDRLTQLSHQTKKYSITDLQNILDDLKGEKSEETEKRERTE